MEEGTFVGWLKKEGDLVRAGEPFTLDGDNPRTRFPPANPQFVRGPTTWQHRAVGELLGYLWVVNQQLRCPVSSPSHWPTKSPPNLSSSAANSSPGDTDRRAAAGLSSNRKANITPRPAQSGGTRGGLTHLRAPGAADASGARRCRGQWDPQHGDSNRQGCHHRLTFPDLAIELAILKPLGHEVATRWCKTESELVGHRGR
jgi:hypothetical protein